VTADNVRVSAAEVVHHIEDGEIAHTAVRIMPMPDADIENTKTAIIDRLSNLWTGPLRHTCECDEDIDPHPSFALTVPPAGEYFDTRSHLSILWYLFRFWACYWVWRVRANWRGGSAPLHK
jgi:hypothetical protein